MSIVEEKFKNEFKLLEIKEKEFDFFDIIPPKEVLVSKWIEFILNPKINGIGNMPLQKLIELCDNNYNLDEYEYDSSYTELATDNLKRMDIVLKYKGLWIVIENKIESFENGDQTNEYYKYINKTKDDNNVIYIYLKPNYNKSKPINNAFKVVTYDKFIESLKSITEIDYTEKNKYKYLKEFVISGGRFMKNEEMEISDSLKFYVENLDKFNAIEEEYSNKNKMLFNKIETEVLAAISFLDKKYNCYKSGNWMQFYKDNWHNEKHNGAHFEVIFKESKIIGRKIQTYLVLHIENNITEEKLKNLKLVDITKKGSQALLKGNEIKEQIMLDFTTIEAIDESIETIKKMMISYVNRFELMIDNSLR